MNVEKIIRLVKDMGLIVSLSDSVKLADEIMAMHSERVCTVENNAFDAGKLAGYEKGYAAGKMDSEEYHRGYADGQSARSEEDGYTIDRLQDIESKMIKVAELAAHRIAGWYPNSKIRAIKTLRNSTGLSLAQCKAIMDKVHKQYGCGF